MFYAVGRADRVHHLEVEDPVHQDLYIVAGYAELGLHVEYLLPHLDLIGDPLDHRDDEVEPRSKGPFVLAKLLHQICLRLRHNVDQLKKDEDHKSR